MCKSRSRSYGAGGGAAAGPRAGAARTLKQHLEEQQRIQQTSDKHVLESEQRVSDIHEQTEVWPRQYLRVYFFFGGEGRPVACAQMPLTVRGPVANFKHFCISRLVGHGLYSASDFWSSFPDWHGTVGGKF